MSLRPRILCLLLALASISIALAAPVPSHAQQAPSSSSDTAFVSLVRGTELSVGALLQVDGAVSRTEAPNTFELRVARLRFRGAAHRLQFFVQTEFLRSPAVLDTRLRFALSEGVSVAAGMYKAPFSSEFLLFRGDLTFLERSRVVNALAPRRQTGVSVRADLVPNRLRVEAGVFNGNGARLRTNDNDAFLYVGRVTSTHPLGRDGQLILGANAAYSLDEAVALDPAPRPFSGQRVVGGLDVRLTWDAWLFAAEGIAARLDPTDGSAYQPHGFHVTGGYRIAPRHQVVARADVYSDDRAATDESTNLLVGYNVAWTPTATLQVNYRAPSEDITRGTVGARLQLALN